MATKKQLEEAIESHLALLEVASRRAREQEALSAARLAEVQQLQDEVVELQVGLGDALDEVERLRNMVRNRNGAIEYLEGVLRETPRKKLGDSFERFKRALLRLHR